MPYQIIGGIGEMVLADNCTMENKANVLTLNNQIMLCGNATITDYNYGIAFATLSEESMFPDTMVIIPVYVMGDALELCPLRINPSGELALLNSYSSVTVYLNGIQFTVNSKYYTPEIGNIFNDGTSPLTDEW